MQDIGEGMTYETSSDVYVKLNTDISSNIVESIGTAVEDRITALSDAFDVGTDLASWVNLINEVSDLIIDVADASEAIGELPEWIPEAAEQTYNEFSSGLRKAAEGISAVKNKVFDSEKFVELINAELSKYGTGLSLNLLAKPSSDEKPTETQEHIGVPQILKFSSLADSNSSDLQPLTASGEFNISDSADWNTASEDQSFQIQQLETNILRDKDGNAIKSFINEQANYVSGLTYELDLDNKGLTYPKQYLRKRNCDCCR